MQHYNSNSSDAIRGVAAGAGASQPACSARASAMVPAADRGAQTPFADAVLRLRRDQRHSEQIVSFHALPWSQGRSLPAGPIGEKYEQLFGKAFLASDVAYSCDALDSFFRPTASLDAAQQLTADAFGADYSFFVTSGTTVANQIAVDVLAGAGRRVLVDRTSHQSIHFAAGRAAATVDYAASTDEPHGSRQALLDVPRMLRTLARAAAAGRPYDAVVLAASSYDGVLYDLQQVFAACLEASPATAFVVDEAWSAINAFHARLRPLTALGAAGTLAAAGTPMTLLVTHSAHKSMSAARQGSYLHAVGDDALLRRVAAMLYTRHTTSPSIPILASLDLARAHAESRGARLVQRSLDLAARVRHTIAHDPALSAFGATSGVLDDAEGGYFAEDPTKVFVDVTGLGMTGDETRLRLLHDYDIYVSRTLREGFLLNLHIGIVERDVQRLLQALRMLARREHGRTVSTRIEPGDDGTVVDGLHIAYPPGVPLAVPGEPWTQRLREQLEDSHRRGAELYSLPVGDGRRVRTAGDEEAS